MAKKGGDTTLAPSAGAGWDAWGAACEFTSWSKAAEAIGITVAQMVMIRKKAPRKTIRLAMDAVLAAQPRAVPDGLKLAIAHIQQKADANHVVWRIQNHYRGNTVTHMTPTEAAEILRQHNAWRRDDEEPYDPSTVHR